MRTFSICVDRRFCGLALQLALVAACVGPAGCGGSGISEAELRRRAIQRPKDDNENIPPATGDARPGARPGGEGVGSPTPPPPPSAAQGTNAPPAAAQAQAEAAASTSPPARPVTETERRARSIENLERIGKALASYVQKNGQLPPGGMPRDGELMLSWRVLILPELGYGDLYRRFKHNEPWDSPHNRLLLDYIPPEYQSPERFDAKTNYLGVAGRGMAIATGSLESLRSGVKVAELRDGLENTLAIVEVDDPHAVEWTRPVDHLPRLDAPADGLGLLRGDGAFGVLASGRVVLLPAEMPASALAALLTAAGGEPVNLAAALNAPTAEPPPPSIATLPDDPAAADRSPLEAAEETAAAAPSAPSLSALQAGSASDDADSTKQQVPDEASLNRARELLRELYGEALQEARQTQQRRKIVQAMLADAASFEANPANYYELVRIARDLAADSGDTASVCSACEMLEQRFQVEPLTTRLTSFQNLSMQVKEPRDVEMAASEVRRLARDAFDRDRYDVAIPASELLLKLVRMQGLKAEASRAQQQGEAMVAAQRLHAAAEQALATLQENSADAAANEAVGRYLCLVKNRWQAGLPYLSRAADVRLRGLASLDLASDRSLDETLSLADQYWDLADRFSQPQRRGLHLRAAHHYAGLEARLAGGLERMRISRRLDAAAGQYGPEEVDRPAAPLPGTRAAVGSRP